METTYRRSLRALLLFAVNVASMLHANNALATVALAKKRASVVTGANGYVGRELVHALLEDPIQKEIVCLVRPGRIPDEEAYWNSNNNNKSSSSASIKVMPYDMLDDGASLDSSLQSVSSDCDCCVYHVASVFGPTEDHVATAKENVRGTEQVVRSVAKHEGCRLVLTSSMAAVRGTGQAPLNGKVYTYKDWNTQSKLGENWGASYQWSKAESERKAWQLAKELNVPMVSLCPSFVFGPPSDNRGTSNSYSISLVGQWVRGESPVQSRLCVDVRDVAKAHVAAGTRSTCIGNRYILSAEARIPSQQAAEALKRVARETGLGDPDKISYDAEFTGGAIPIGENEVEALERLKSDLGGLELIPVEQTMKDMGKVLLQMQAATVQ